MAREFAKSLYRKQHPNIDPATADRLFDKGVERSMAAFKAKRVGTPEAKPAAPKQAAGKPAPAKTGLRDAMRGAGERIAKQARAPTPAARPGSTAAKLPASPQAPRTQAAPTRGASAPPHSPQAPRGGAPGRQVGKPMSGLDKPGGFVGEALAGERKNYDRDHQRASKDGLNDAERDRNRVGAPQPTARPGSAPAALPAAPQAGRAPPAPGVPVAKGGASPVAKPPAGGGIATTMLENMAKTFGRKNYDADHQNPMGGAVPPATASTTADNALSPKNPPPIKVGKASGVYRKNSPRS